MKDKTKVLKTYRDLVWKTAICQPNWGAGYKPAPQIADIYTQWINLNFVYIQK